MLINQKTLDRLRSTQKRFEKRQPESSRSIIAPEEPEKLVKPSQVLDFIHYNHIEVKDFIGDVRTKERVINKNDLLPINFFHKGIKLSKAVGRVTIISDSGEEEGFGTGFLIGRNLLMTNNHVLDTKEVTQNSIIEFEYELDENNSTKSSVSFRLDPVKLFFTSPDLDFTIVYVVDDSITGGKTITDYGSIPLIAQVGKITTESSVSIIQHPSGRRKSIALRNNTVKDILDHFLHYETDTEPGSSGSPVFNDTWEIVAIHHSGVPRRNAQGQILTKAGTVIGPGDDEDDIDWIANEGVRISSILKHVQAEANAQQKILLKEILQNLPPESNNDGNTGSGNNGTGNNTSYYDAPKDKELKLVYYATTPLDNGDLFERLNELISKTHKKKLDYTPSKYLYPDVDKQPNGKVASVYSGKEYSAEEFILADEQVDAKRRMLFLELSKNENLVRIEDYQAQLESLEASLPYNCEHVVPQSWFNKSNPMRGDLHHLFACESNCNSFRSNIPYFDFADFDPQVNPAEVVRDECGKRESTRFEPQFNQGAVARATLYFLLRYPGNIKSNYDKNRLEVLISWHKKFPVTDYERRRNWKIAQMQGNRNPLIDFPELVDRINLEKGL
ncbi:MAG: endonuclease [Saprospiraceae bacterium]